MHHVFPEALESIAGTKMKPGTGPKRADMNPDFARTFFKICRTNASQDFVWIVLGGTG